GVVGAGELDRRAEREDRRGAAVRVGGGAEARAVRGLTDVEVGAVVEHEVGGALTAFGEGLDAGVDGGVVGGGEGGCGAGSGRSDQQGGDERRHGQEGEEGFAHDGSLGGGR